MRKLALLSCFALIAAAPPPSPDARLRAIIAPVSAAQMKQDVETLVSFGTRHTLSSQTDPKRGIGAALAWGEAEFGRYSAACGGCLTVSRASDVFTGAAIGWTTGRFIVHRHQRAEEAERGPKVDLVPIPDGISARISF